MAKRKQPITINGQNYLMVFGLSFLERLNNQYKLEADHNIKIDFGVSQAMVELSNQNPLTVAYMIEFSTANNHHRPSLEDIEAYIDEQLETDEKAEKLFEDFLDYLKTAPGAQRIFNRAKKAQEELKEKEQLETEVETNKDDKKK